MCDVHIYVTLCLRHGLQSPHPNSLLTSTEHTPSQPTFTFHFKEHPFSLSWDCAVGLEARNRTRKILPARSWPPMPAHPGLSTCNRGCSMWGRLQVSTLRDETKEYKVVLGQHRSRVYLAHWIVLPNDDCMETGSVLRSDRQQQVLNTVMQ